ncbi:MAG: 7-cyano-7-deazaguanine synthase, partial [Planctomycetota bacterium]
MTRPGRTEPDAVVLLSGGLDSTTVLAIAIDAGRDPLALTFSYGQTHGLEVERSRAVAEAAGTGDPLVLPLPFREIGGLVKASPRAALN